MKTTAQNIVLNLVYSGVLLFCFAAVLYPLTLSSNVGLSAVSEPLVVFLIQAAPFIMLGSIAFYFVINRNSESFL